MRIAFFLSRFPYPLEKGDKLRAYHQIKHLSKHHTIDLFAISYATIPEKDYDELSQYCQNIYVFKVSKLVLPFVFLKALFTQVPFQCHYFYRKNVDRIIRKKIHRETYDVLFCQLVRMAPYVKNYPHFKVIDYMDALSTGVQKRVAKVSWWKKSFFKAEAKRLKRYEHLIYEYFNAHTIISKVDQKRILHPQNNTIHVIPNGIDTHFFKSIEAPKDKTSIVFTGNMSYPPNEDAASFLVQRILPLLPHDTQIVLAGAAPSYKVKSLQNNRVKVTGWLDDIRSAYNHASVFIAPMQIGTGVQNKILEAMSMKVPCIISQYAAQSLMGENNVHYIVCETPEEYAAAYQKLQSDQDFRVKLCDKARQLVKEQYSWQRATDQLSHLLENS